jgi:predicted permease
VFWRRKRENDLERELRAHLDLESEELDSSDAARRAFGNVARIKEEVREVWGWTQVERVFQDLKFALRQMRRTPGFSLLAVLTLALGIGASTSIFCVLDSVLLRQLPYAAPDRLVLVREQLKPIAPDPMPVPAPDSVEIMQSQVFAESGTIQNRRFDFSSGTNVERILGARVSPSDLRLLGVPPLHGRLLNDDEDRPGVHVAILGYDLWRRASGDANLIGKTILLDREPYLVAGIMPRQFVFPPEGIRWEKPAEVYVPLALTRSELALQVDYASFGIIARLAPGVTVERASARMESLAQSSQAHYSAEIQRELPKNIQLHGVVHPLKDEAIGASRSLLFILMGAVAVLLLIACANVAGMLLGQAASRVPEIAMRLALGAGRTRLVRQLLTESLLLGILGGFFGMLLAVVATDSAASWLPPDVPRISEIHFNFHVLGFALAASTLTTFIFGLAPALLATRSDLDVNLRQSGRHASARTRAFTVAVVVAEIALTVVLQTGAALLIRSLIHVRAQTTSGDRATSVSLALPGSSYRDSDAIRGFYQEALRKIAEIPGVNAVAAASSLPYSEGSQRVYTVEHRPGSQVVPYSIVLGDYFEALAIPVRSGRVFQDSDRDVVVINQTAARTFWPGEDPIGKRVKAGVLRTPTPWLTIVGVAADFEQRSADRAIRPQFYEAFSRDLAPDAMSIVARSPAGLGLAGSLRATLRSMDSALPLSRIQTLDRAREDALAPRRTTTQIVASFAGTALMLAAVGIYGLMLQLVTDRRREIAIRMALGASRSSILAFVLKRGMLLVAVGFLIGLAASLGLRRFVTAMIFGVGSTDPVAYMATAIVFASTALIALCGPTRLASRVDTNVVLHE